MDRANLINRLEKAFDELETLKAKLATSLEKGKHINCFEVRRMKRLIRLKENEVKTLDDVLSEVA